MASIDFASLRQPLSDPEPCGPDLEYDDDYLNFVANIEGLMPTSFFGEGQPFTFDPGIVNVDQEIARIVDLLSRTRDLRLLTLMARLLILSRDLHGFARAAETIAGLMTDFWDDVHPRAEDGNFAMRAATLATLNESTVIFSLQYSRLCESRRTGPANFRAYLYAIREAEPRDGEDRPPESAILQTLREAEEQTLAARTSLEILRQAFDQIGALWIERADMMSAPKLTNVAALVKRMLALIDMAFPRAVPADASATEAGTAAEGPIRMGDVVSAADAVAALAAAANYFLIREPSSPVLPLVAQAQQLLGKSFIDVLQTLLPEHVGAAAFQIGSKQFFPLPVERLQGLLPEAPAYGGVATPDAPAEDSAGEWSSWSTETTESDASAEPPADGSAEPAEVAPAATRRNGHSTRHEIVVATAFSAENRAQALGLLERVSAWLRVEEPSSPVPWLIERARALADRDFLSVLRAVMPANALTDLDHETGAH